MNRPVEELLEIRKNNERDKYRIVNFVLRKLDKTWKADIDLAKINKNDLLQMLDDDTAGFKDSILVGDVLDLLIKVFKDSESLSILLKSPYSEPDWAVVLFGFYGRKARRAIPWLRGELGGQTIPRQAENALLRIGISPKVLYTGLRIAIKENDSQGFDGIMDFAVQIYPGFKTSTEMVKILDGASHVQGHNFELSFLDLLAEMPYSLQLQYKTILQRLAANDKDQIIHKKATKILGSLSE